MSFKELIFRVLNLPSKAKLVSKKPVVQKRICFSKCGLKLDGIESTICKPDCRYRFRAIAF